MILKFWLIDIWSWSALPVSDNENAVLHKSI